MLDAETRHVLHVSTGSIIFVLGAIHTHPSAPNEWLVWGVVFGGLFITVVYSARWLLRGVHWVRKWRWKDPVPKKTVKKGT